MKKTNLLLGATALLALTGAVASPLSVRKAPALQEPRNTASPQRIINDEKALGTYMFAQTSIDSQHERAFVNLYSSQPHILNKMANVWDTSDALDNRLYVMYAGANSPSGYYGMLAQAYSIGTYAYGWIKVNTQTGEYEELAHLRNDAGFQWEGSVDYAYNPGDGKFYGMAPDMDYDPETEAVRSVVGTVNTENARFTQVRKLPYYYFAFAFDYDGIPYGVRWKVDLNVSDQPLGAYLTRFTKTWDVDTEFELKPEGNDFKLYYVSTMDFDYTTGDLYWAGMNLDAHQYLFRINPDNGEIEKLGGVGYNEALTGLYVPFQTADHREAPARVEDLSFAASEDGANRVTLSWTNPSTQWNRKPLTDLGDVEIYRNDIMTPIALASGGEPGQAMTYTDDRAPEGLHTYYVIPTNAKGLGVMDSIRAYSGHDVPGKVENLNVVAANQGRSVNVVWKAPATGAREGWYDTQSLTYNVTRLPDGKQIATGLTKPMVKDENIEVVERYSYVVTPVNADGEGTPRESDGILAGTYVPLPYSTDFSNSTDARRWTPRDNNGDNTRFEYCDFTWPNGVNQCWRLILPEVGTNDDDLVSPPLKMEAGKTYKLTFHVNFHEIGFSHLLNFKAGSDLAALQTFESKEYTTHESHYDTNVPFTVYYTATETAPTYVALNLASGPALQETVRVYGFEAEEEFDKDLAALGLDCPLELVAGQPNTLAVEVFNNGFEKQTAYKVQVVNGNAVIGETSAVPALESRTAAKVEFTVNPVDQLIGNLSLRARVVLEGDKNAANDLSPEKAVEILAPGSYMINHVVSTDELGQDTRLPMAHYYGYSLVQTVYPAAEHNLQAAADAMCQDSDDPLIISRLGWEYELLPEEGYETGVPMEVLGTELVVALGQTSSPGYSPSNYGWLSDRQKVYSGTVQFHEGKHYLVVNLKTPFHVDPSKSLIVTVAKGNPSNAGEWGPKFTTYGDNWSSPTYWHSLRADNKVDEVNVNGKPSATLVPNAPRLLLALGSVSGVGEVADFENAITYDASTGCIRLLGINARSITVYDASGRTVESSSLSETEDTYPVSLAKGVYLVSVADASGKVRTAKIFIR